VGVDRGSNGAGAQPQASAAPASKDGAAAGTRRKKAPRQGPAAANGNGPGHGVKAKATAKTASAPPPPAAAAANRNGANGAGGAAARKKAAPKAAKAAARRATVVESGAAQLGTILHLEPASLAAAGRAAPGAPCALHLGSLAAEAMQQSDEDGACATASSRLDPRTLNYREAQAGAVVSLYSSLCQTNRLDDALHLMKESIRANRSDVLVT
jgi:hypothetical protein